MIFRFGSYRLDTRLLELRHDDAPVPIEPQVFDLLRLLIENRDRIVSKDEIIDTVWGGRIVSEATLSSRINAVRRAVGDDGTRQDVVRTLPRRGFRFVQLVEVRDEDPASTPGELAAHLSEDDATLDISASKIHQQAQSPEKPSIAVLPFDNLSGDLDQEYFSDGITEDIITALSRIRWFFVTARNSSFSYKGTSPDVRRVARELGVRYVIEGSVRRSDNRVRISAKLVDGSTGNHVWVERYDGEVGDVFDLQDEMTEKIVGAVEPAITKAEIQRSKSKRPDNLDAWDLCQRGWWHRYRNRREDYVEALKFFGRALEKDPEFGSALAGMADALSYEVVFSFADEPAAQIEGAIHFGRRAVEIDDEDPIAHLSLGRAYAAGRQFESAIQAFRNALRLNPYFAAALYSLGTIYIVTGRLDEGIDAIRKSIALSPQDPFIGPSYARLAQAFLAMKDYEKAVENAEEAFRCPVQPHWPGKSYLVSALGHLDRHNEAKRAIEELLHLSPGITVGWVRSQDLPISMGRDCREDYLEGLRRAGLPE